VTAFEAKYILIYIGNLSFSKFFFFSNPNMNQFKTLHKNYDTTTFEASVIVEYYIKIVFELYVGE